MRKGTKKNIIHGILIIIVVIFALMASVIAAFRDLTVQSMIARSIAGELSERFNAHVKIRTFYVTEKLEVRIEDMQVDDLVGLPMFFIGDMTAKFSPMIMFNDIVIKDLYMKDVLGRLVKYEDAEKLNVNDMIAHFGGGKGEKKKEGNSDFHLQVENFKLDNGHVIFWNQHKDNPDKLSMDYAHIDIDSIYCEATDLEIRQDSVMGDVHTLRGHDKCGLVLEDARGDVLFCEKCLNIDNLILKTGESQVDLDLRFEYETSHAYLEFVDSVRIIGNIRPSTLKLSDIKYFAWVLDKMPDKFFFTANYDGSVGDFTVSNFDADFGNESHIDADVTFSGLPDFFDTYIDVTVRNMISSYDDTKNFGIPASSLTVPIPDMLSGIGKYSMSGSYQGYARDFRTQFNLMTEMGDVNAEVYLNTTENSAYSFDIDVDNLKLNDLLGFNDDAQISFETEMSGVGLEVDDTEFDADVHISDLVFMGNKFENISVNGDFENSKFTANTKIRHPYLHLNLSSIIDLSKDLPSYNINSRIRNADLVNLHLSDFDTIMLLSSNILADFKGNNIDNLTGTLSIDKTTYFNGNEYVMNDFQGSITEKDGVKDFSIDCDFFDFSASGIINFKTIGNALANTAQRYVDMPGWYDNITPDKLRQEFWLSLNLKDTRQLSKLFVPSLYVARGATINATYASGYSYHGSTIEAPEVWFNGLKFKNIEIKNTAKFDEFTSKATIEDIIIRDTTDRNPEPISLENFVLMSRFGDNKVNVDMIWDDDVEEDHNKARIKSTFVPHATDGGLLTLNSEVITINDTSWYLRPDCSIDFRKDGTVFNNVELYTDAQKMSVHGTFPKHDTDTLYAEFHNVDVSDFDFITLGNKIDFDGILNGFVGFSGMNDNFSFSSDINLDNFYLNGKEVGDAKALAKWHDPDESIFVNMDVFNKSFGDEDHESIGVMGYYYPRKQQNNLKFDMLFDEFKLETLSPFLSSVVNRMNGFASGNMKIRGSISEPVIVGDVMLKNAGCQVNYLNTYYTINDDIRIEENKIVFEDVMVKDTIGHIAVVNGSINHNHLKDVNFDLTLQCEDFFALNIPAEKANGFYGTAIADGTVKITGPVNDVTLDIDVVSKKGTVIDVPLSGTTNVDNNFVVFIQKSEETDTLVETYIPEVVKDDSNFTMNLNAEVNSDAAVNIYLPQNMGSINARGNGNINIGIANEEFNLIGDYLITSGAFNFTLDMVRRTFTLREGGTLRWTGDPTDADINIVGVYRTKSSLTSLGTTAVDSTALTNNINVDCIIKLTDKLMNPTITFGIELPNVKEDTKMLVYSVIDTTNQAIMAQQVFSLMVLGSFAYTAGSNISRFGTTAGYSVITNQLSSWLSQISEDFDIGINYTPDDQLTNEEIEVSLSTQLFDDRLIIEGNFGVIRGNRSDANDVNNIVGDVDLTWKLSKRWSLKVYNHTNIKNNYYYYSFENYSDFTQGIGIAFSQSFDTLREVFTIHKKNKKKDVKNEPDPK